MELVTCDISEFPSNFSRKVIKDVLTGERFVNFKASFISTSQNGDNYMGEMFRIKVTGNKSDKSSESLHLMLKLSPNSPIFRSYFPVDGFYRKEVYAYNVLLPYFESVQDEFNIPYWNRFKYPKCFKASSEETKEFIVMEDLAVKGFKMCDRFKSLDSNHLEMIVKNLAHFHAFSFVIKQRDPRLFAEMARHASNSMDYGDRFKPLLENSIKESIAVIEDEICKQKVQIFTVDSYDRTCKFFEPDFAAPYNVICHGDCWTNNILFKYEGTTPVDIRILDWQIIRHTSPITDLAYVIFLSTDEETRSRSLPAIFDLYYETLGSRLREMDTDVEICYPKKVFTDHLRKILPLGLMYSLFAVPIQQSEVGKAPDFVDLLENGDPVLKETYSQNCIDRIRGIANDIVKFDNDSDSFILLHE